LSSWLFKPHSEATWVGSGPVRSCADTRSSCGTSGCKMSDMDVEVLVVPDCPNESVAISVLRLAFDRVGLAAQPIRISVIASQQQAEERGFVGSPTFLLDGVDPFGVAGQSPAFACRVYATPAGLSGVPPLGDLVSALTAARDQGLASPNEQS
jgi:hypothetical protein